MSQSAKNGNIEAMFILGQLYKSGAGVEKDQKQSVRWLSSAAINGHKGAQILLGDMYETGDGVDMDHEEAGRWYDMADDKNRAAPAF